MTEYTPNNWIAVKFEYEGKTYAKILGGWSGGYLDGDSWRLNSGVSRIEDDGDYYSVYGASGSVYKCYKHCERVTMIISGVLKSLEDNGAETITMTDLIDKLESGEVERA